MSIVDAAPGMAVEKCAQGIGEVIDQVAMERGERTLVPPSMLVRPHSHDGGNPRLEDTTMKSLFKFTIVATCLLPAGIGLAQEGEITAESLQARLEGVAPPQVLENSTLVEFGEGGEMQTLREGTNGWTCLYPGGDPMCVDAGGFEFIQALMTGEDPSEGNLGFAYMLLGDEGTSNIAPGATEETPDNEWVQTGPHVMVMGPGAAPMIEAYPTEVPESVASPWVMWPETPYAHLMMPVE